MCFFTFTATQVLLVLLKLQQCAMMCSSVDFDDAQFCIYHTVHYCLIMNVYDCVHFKTTRDDI